MTSEIAAIVAFIFAVYEHGHDKTIAGWSFLIISILLFLLGTYVAWRKEYEVAEKLRELESTKPRIRLRGPQEAYIEPISQNWQGTITKAQFLKLKFINDPECPHHNAVATDVRAHVEYYRSSDNKLVQSIEGRWSRSDEPSASSPLQSKTYLLPAKFGIGEEHELDIAYYNETTKRYYVWNNENYKHENFLNPAYLLDGSEFSVDIRLRGTLVDEHYSLRFKSTNGTFEVEKCTAMPQAPLISR